MYPSMLVAEEIEYLGRLHGMGATEAASAARSWLERLEVGREIRERLRSRMFRVVTFVLLTVVAAAVVIPTIHSRTTQSQKVGVVTGSATLTVALEDLAQSAGAPRRRARLATGPSGPQLRPTRSQRRCAWHAPL